MICIASFFSVQIKKKKKKRSTDPPNFRPKRQTNLHFFRPYCHSTVTYCLKSKGTTVVPNFLRLLGPNPKP